MSGVATQPPPGAQDPPPTNGGPPGPEGPHDTNGPEYKGPPGQVNGPPGPPGQRGPPPPANALQIQKMLDENSTLISTISEYQKMGRHNETLSYQVGFTSVQTPCLQCSLSVAVTPEPDEARPDGGLQPEPPEPAAPARSGAARQHGRGQYPRSRGHSWTSSAWCRSILPARIQLRTRCSSQTLLRRAWSSSTGQVRTTWTWRSWRSRRSSSRQPLRSWLQRSSWRTGPVSSTLQQLPTTRRTETPEQLSPGRISSRSLSWR